MATEGKMESAPGRLAITRKPGQSVHIGDVEVHIIAVRGQHVKLSITAPRDMPIVRDDAHKTEQRPLPKMCPVCGGTGRDPASDNVNWLRCGQCTGRGVI